MILAARHTGIVVRDMATCLRFWRDVMGLQVVIDFWEEGEFIDTVQALSDVKLHMIKLRAPDGSMVELLHDSHHPGGQAAEPELCDRGIRHLAFTVANVAAAHQELRAAGCRVLSEPTTAPDGKARLFFARDPEGNLIEIVEMLDHGQQQTG